MKTKCQTYTTVAHVDKKKVFKEWILQMFFAAVKLQTFSDFFCLSFTSFWLDQLIGNSGFNALHILYNVAASKIKTSTKQTFLYLCFGHKNY